MKKKFLYLFVIATIFSLSLAACGKEEPVEDLEPVSVVEETPEPTEEPEPAKFTVTFEDGDGNVLSTEEVEEGSAAKAPEDPTKDGFDFIGWDKDFSKVTEDMTVKATWEEQILVLTADTSEDVDEEGNLLHPLVMVEVKKNDGTPFTKDDKITLVYEELDTVADALVNAKEEVDDSSYESLVVLKIDGLEKNEDPNFYSVTFYSDDLEYLNGTTLFTGDGESLGSAEYDLTITEKKAEEGSEEGSEETEATSEAAE